MGSVDVEVAAGRLDAFRMAAAVEVAFDAGYLRDPEAEDVPTQLRYLRSNLAVLDQLAAADGAAVTVTEDAGSLAHIAEEMARRVIGPKLADQLRYGPIDGKASEVLQPLIADLEWAVATAAHCHEITLAELAERRAA